LLVIAVYVNFNAVTNIGGPCTYVMNLE